MNKQEYAGFWIRTAAALIDSILILIIITPVLLAIYGVDYFSNESFIKGFWHFSLNYIFPIIATTVFWIYKSATPGKLVNNLTIVDAKTGRKPSNNQFIGRCFAYYVSVIPLMLGIIWIGFDKRKQGWHDKLAGTVVIKNSQIEPVKFEG